ncbi:MAG TPA: hypothetical protein VFX48_01735, partial [Saprospiraceae bacterium]|nr:hypothetical protein [Saprospiraceae bacterium]
DRLEWSLLVLVLLGAVFFLVPPDYFSLRQVSAYAIHWLFLCLCVGIAALFAGMDRLLYAAFGASAIMALFLMNAYNMDLRLARGNEPEGISLVFANLSLSEDGERNSLAGLNPYDADLLLFEECTPDAVPLFENLHSDYPHQLIMPRADPQGKAILSKFPFIERTSFTIAGHLVVQIGIRRFTGDSFRILIANALPPITMTAYQQLHNFLDSLSNHIRPEWTGTILAANFNVIPWSKEFRSFRLKTGMVGSRRDNQEGSTHASALDFFLAPYNEILFSGHLECSRFQVIADTKGNPFGLYGRYQFKKRLPLANPAR